MIINHNINAMHAHRNLLIQDVEASKHSRHLSSGLRIDRAQDDAAGLAVSEKMRSQIRGLHRANYNAQDGLSMLQTAEGFLQGTTNALHRIGELAVQAANGPYTTQDRQYIQVEVNQLIAEIDRIASQAEFNTLKLFTGNFAEVGGEKLPFHIGANMDQRIFINLNRMNAEDLGLRAASGASNPPPTTDTEPTNGAAEPVTTANPTQQVAAGDLNVTTSEDANRSIATVQSALDIVLTERANIGAFMNRLEKIVDSTALYKENLQASESRIRDADMAHEMINYTSRTILQNTAMTMLAHANLTPTMIMKVLE